MNLAHAIALASHLHKGQTDKSGKPYILHPLRVMQKLLYTGDEELLQIAILHDCMEDCGLTRKKMQVLGYSERVIRGVELVSNLDHAPYPIFCERMKDSLDACLVKREDIRHNSDITRLKGVREKDFDRLNKYCFAMIQIEGYIKVLQTHGC
jgi:(p)ppGpp synthase/HD superfamily hydrolase